MTRRVSVRVRVLGRGKWEVGLGGRTGGQAGDGDAKWASSSPKNYRLYAPVVLINITV